MKLTTAEATIVTAGLAVVNYLQLELGSISHTAHIAIGSVSILLAGLLVNRKEI